jgi:hypothetical protein
MKLNHRFLFPLLLITVITIAFLGLSTLLRKSRLNGYGNEGRLLPNFNVVSASGKRISSKELIGNNIYIQFINSSYEEDIVLLETVFNNWNNSKIVIIGIVDDIDVFIKKSKLKLDDVFLVSQEYKALKTLFKSPSGFSSFYIFNKAGHEFASGQSLEGYKNSVRVFLNQLLYNKYFLIESFVDIRKNINEIEWLHQYSESRVSHYKLNKTNWLQPSVIDS